MAGDAVQVKVTNPSIYVGGAKVMQPDIITRNGVVHIVNAVLAPA